MQVRHELVCHPATPAIGISRIYVFVSTIGEAPEECSVWFTVHSDGSLKIPRATAPARANELWQTTCFELFLKPTDCTSYVEFNLSPSFAWAAYEFDDYRRAGRDLALRFDPEILLTPTDGRIVSVEADLDVSMLKRRSADIGLSAVIEQTDGTKSYWALAHAPGPPDFHNPACFIATLPAPDVP